MNIETDDSRTSTFATHWWPPRPSFLGWAVSWRH